MTKKELYDMYLCNRSERCFTTFSHSFDYYEGIPWQMNIERFCVFMDANMKVNYVIVITQSFSINNGIFKSLNILITDYCNNQFEFDEEMLFASVNPDETTIVESEANTILYLNDVGELFIDTEYHVGERIFKCAKDCTLKGCYGVLKRGEYGDNRFTLDYKESIPSNETITNILNHVSFDKDKRFVAWYNDGNEMNRGLHNSIFKAIYCDDEMRIKYAIVITAKYSMSTSCYPTCTVEISDFTEEPIKIYDNIPMVTKYLVGTISTTGTGPQPGDVFDSFLDSIMSSELRNVFDYGIRHNILADQLTYILKDIEKNHGPIAVNFAYNAENVLTKYSAKAETE